MALPLFCSNNSICRISLLVVKSFYKPKLRFFTQTTSAFNKIDALESISDDKSKEHSNTYTVIYRYPYMRIGAVINILKWPQTLLTAAAIPTTSLLYFFDVIPGSTVLVTSYLGLALTLCLYSTGFTFTRAIGFIYLSKDEKTVKISYLNFWGRRVNLERPIEDFLFFHELPKSFTDILYKTVLLYSSQDKFKLMLPKTGGLIFDIDKFVKIFGDVK